MIFTKIRQVICENYLKYAGFSISQIRTLFLCQKVIKEKLYLKVSEEDVKDKQIDLDYIFKIIDCSFLPEENNYLIKRIS